MTNINDKFIGKVVAIRGPGSGINMGKCVAFEGKELLLEPNSCFLRKWEYANSHGAFHSLARGDVSGGTITLTKNDTIITDVAQCVICDDGVLEKVRRFAK